MTLNRVMTVDDDRFDQLAYRRILKKTNAEIDLLPFQYATEALEYLKSPTRQPVDVILLDINMPRMDGFEFLEEYRSNFSQEVPVVVITGADLTEDDKKFLSGEVTRILAKTPETEGTIASDVAKILRNVRMDKK